MANVRDFAIALASDEGSGESAHMHMRIGRCSHSQSVDADENTDQNLDLKFRSILHCGRLLET